MLFQLSIRWFPLYQSEGMTKSLAVAPFYGLLQLLWGNRPTRNATQQKFDYFVRAVAGTLCHDCHGDRGGYRWHKAASLKAWR